ncbi:MAG TPA: diadenylate cyclase CdaA [Ignavibacteria bacterium]|nr:TIGR00159 family protein [Bacteroidota bacterium]HRI84850.1 diadenylate cyclase CdaA [Ignavibacteria bacterium]HRJ99786.1 diadenylate cyclase CdaA [Ignavibacteria bacterium]
MELFKIGFLTVKLIDIIDILLVTYVFYKLYTVMKGTIASQIFIALVFVFGFSFIAQLLNMQAMGWLLGSITDIWIIALIVLFQPEIRRLLQLIGKTRVARIFTKVNVDANVMEITEASFELKSRGWGALIVIERSSGLKSVMESGELVQSKISKELIITIFTPKSPLHDGAIILKNGKIEAARCLLPLSEHEKIRNKNLGTRHRAGIGITEVSDAVAIIISEERKQISVAEDGKLEYYDDKKMLTERLVKAMGKESVAEKVKDIFEEGEKEIVTPDDKKE